MKRRCSLAFVLLFLLFVSLGCTSEDKRQWHEAMRDWRGDNMRFGSHTRNVP